ncbi:hypothetical protein HDU76_011528, partial [Blyttiomyces sp. JEL0837]
KSSISNKAAMVPSFLSWYHHVRAADIAKYKPRDDDRNICSKRFIPGAMTDVKAIVVDPHLPAVLGIELPKFNDTRSLAFSICTFGSIKVEVAQGHQLDLNQFSNRVLSYDDSIVSKLKAVAVPSIPGEHIKYEVHCNPLYLSSTQEGGSTTAIAKRASGDSEERTAKRIKSTSTPKGKESVVDLTEEVAVRVPNPDFSFL